MSALLCPWCTQSTAGNHEWHCPLMQPQQPVMNAGELDGQSLIELNNVAVGFQPTGNRTEPKP